MPRKRSNKRAPRSRGPRTTIRGPSQADKPGSDAMIRYSGPVHPLGWKANKSVICKELRYFLAAQSTAGGVLNPVFDQTMSNFTLWSNFAAIWDEYRVLKMTLEFMPVNQFSARAAAIVVNPVFVVVDRDSNGALGTTAGALSYESCRIYSLESPWADSSTYIGTRQPPPSFTMDGVNDATWITSSLVVATTKPNIKMYGSGLTASTTYGNFLCRVLVQFRGTF